MLNRTTINARIKRGMTREEAENTPLLIDKKLTLQKVLEVEAHGLSLSDSAYLLRVTPQRLGRFVKSHGIEWRGKKHCYKYGLTLIVSDKQSWLVGCQNQQFMRVCIVKI